MIHVITCFWKRNIWGHSSYIFFRGHRTSNFRQLMGNSCPLAASQSLTGCPVILPARHRDVAHLWRFPESWGYPNSWMLYKGKSH